MAADGMDAMERELRQVAWARAFRETPSVRHANEAARIDRPTYREWLKDPVFVQMKDDADADYNDMLNERLLMVALGRERKPMIGRDGKPICMVKEDGSVEQVYEVYKNEYITMAVAKARMPELYADTPEINVGDMTQEELKEAAKALR